MPRKQSTLLRERNKSLSKINRQRYDLEVKNASQSIDDKIFELKRRIKQCQWDLEHIFPGNEAIEKKIKNMQIILNKLEEEKKHD